MRCEIAWNTRCAARFVPSNEAVKRWTPSDLATSASASPSALPEALALQRVAHGDRDLGGVGMPGVADEARDAGEAAGVELGHRDDRHVVTAVDLGEVTQLVVGQARLGHEEALVARLRRELAHAADQQRLVGRHDEAQTQARPVGQFVEQRAQRWSIGT